MVHQEGWVDLLACIPFFQISWIFRGLRAFFTFHRLSFRQAREDVRREGAEFALFIGIFFVIIVIQLSSIFVLYFENQVSNSNIKTGQDALWWSYVTVSGVGYGDEYPVTSGERLVGIVLMTGGIGIYATLGGYFARRLIRR